MTSAVSRADHTKERLAAYAPVSRRWAAVTERAIDEFRSGVEAVIDEPTTSPSTNIWAALRQADLFLTEPREGRGENGTNLARQTVLRSFERIGRHGCQQ